MKYIMWDFGQDEERYEEAVHAMNRGDEKAKTTVAFFKLSGRGGAEVDQDEAVSLLVQRVKDGDDDAMWMLGMCYEYGMGTEKDISQAVSHYRRSCEAQNVIGEFLFKDCEGGRGNGEMAIRRSS